MTQIPEEETIEAIDDAIKGMERGLEIINEKRASTAGLGGIHFILKTALSALNQSRNAIGLHPSTEWVSVEGYADMVNMIQGHKAAIEVLRTMLNKQGLELGVNTANMMLQDIDKWERNIFPIGGFAPGNYSCKCFQCSKSFRGDKMAVMCLQCALKGIIPAPPSKP
jgi:hypothetical protein